MIILLSDILSDYCPIYYPMAAATALLELIFFCGSGEGHRLSHSSALCGGYECENGAAPMERS